MTISRIDGEDLATRRRRVRYRAWHRGTREMDLILGPFADAHIESYDDAMLDRLETLMDEQDTELLSWVIGQHVPPERIDTELLNALVAYRRQNASIS